ncbi:MAG: hypothetical protein M1837_003673 [Sclerophora amabilis]|nr:MAG: hypothetical protein M1837_003673 [Sclerophora amabilis]
MVSPIVNGACECGYSLKDTGDYFTSSYSLDFNANAPEFADHWIVQSYSTPASGPDAPLPRKNNPENINIEDGNLVLKQSAYSAADKAAGRPVQIAEMESTEPDFFHGSFRITSKLEIDGGAAEKGSCAGWFFFRDDNRELDIEALTWEDPFKIHYTSQPSRIAGRPIPGATKGQQLSVPWSAYAEHRFDWLPGKVSFFENSELNFETTVNVPEVGGPMLMNLWSNGNSWSGTPSTSDVYWRVQSIVMYYNTTSTDSGSDVAFNTACHAAGGKGSSTVCS